MQRRGYAVVLNALAGFNVNIKLFWFLSRVHSGLLLWITNYTQMNPLFSKALRFAVLI